MISFAEKSSRSLARLLAVGLLLLGLVSTAHADLTAGLVAYYPFDGNASDMSGNGNDGTVNGATLGADRFGEAGKSYDFDGNDYLSFGDKQDFDMGTGDFTISAWIKTSSSSRGEITNKGSNVSNTGYNTFVMPSGVLAIEIHDNYAAFSTATVNNGQWRHAVGMRDGDNLNLFVDGVADGSRTGVNNYEVSASNQFYVGSREATSPFFNGSIDEFRVYNRALSANEVTALYQLESTPPPNQAPAFAESNATFTTAENNASASFVVSATDTDANTTLVYAKFGPDAGKFTLNIATGALTFTNTPDYEANASAAGNNAFSLTIKVTDGEANATQAVTVNVTNLLETVPPLISIPAGVYESNSTSVASGLEVALSAFSIEAHEMPLFLWNEVYLWGTPNGYAFSNAGLAFSPDHPVHSVNWYDVVKWANARSEKEGLPPCYYTDVNRTRVYRSGQVDVTNMMVKWSADGYRLPTEAEWEVSARGGLVANNYAWGNSPSTSNANYLAAGLGQTVLSGSYNPNGYGLRDLGGNLREWVWDLNNSHFGHDFVYSNTTANSLSAIFDEVNSSAIYVPETNGFQPFFESTYSLSEVVKSSMSFSLAKTLNFDPAAQIGSVTNQIANKRASGGYPAQCKMKFYYIDGTSAESTTHGHESSPWSWGTKSYANPNTDKLVSKIEVFLKKNYNQSAWGTFERNTRG
ncbi:MAG: SUMF1/EgtB/PvdO family nonheme iron enzyme [Verrucomicrobia bacterium]|nr:SUMF1/EgtB/PvdO family nonheme iron enzyme [Verrucomicrobiota bacterium]